MNKISGIYEIKNKINGDRYIGSSNDIDKRLKEHKRELLIGNHFNPRLQKAWNKYGFDAFELCLFLACETSMLLIEEQKLLNKKPEYNITKHAEAFFTGHNHSEKSKQKISIGMKGKKNSLGYKHPTEDYETRRGKSPWNKGKTGIYSEETRKKISQSLSGKTQSKETILKRSISLQGHRGRLGIKQSDETKRKMSESQKRRWQIIKSREGYSEMSRSIVPRRKRE